MMKGLSRARRGPIPRDHGLGVEWDGDIDRRISISGGQYYNPI